MSPGTCARRRLRSAAMALVVMGTGLVWRLPAIPFSPFVRKYGADALWAWLVFLLIRIVRPQAHIATSAAIAFGFAVVIELTQLYHASWIDEVRATRLGALVLGSVFNWPDIPAYALGVIVGVLIEQVTCRELKS
jgi:hypothetical protein